ncbi:hypothetical protein F383_36281 [Gossypium arboreum]|uniref:Uncharacterized protein n=1 Tax=Gossypium arboreum TaxID=29729 RepID=A0A0B0NCS1_GOSAR|nr:hypothetical protein F383_36281 [Gossypium arboreum]
MCICLGAMFMNSIRPRYDVQKPRICHDIKFSMCDYV